MKKLSQILSNTNTLNQGAWKDSDIKKISFDSRAVDADTLFVAICGSTVDGHDYISQVIEKGCKNIIVSKKQDASLANFVLVENTSIALAETAHSFYDNPSKDLKVIGITGTNGKTTCTTLLHDLFTALGHKSGLVSTVVNKIGTEKSPSTHTTPNPVALAELFAQMRDADCEYVFMEVSSHAIHQNRIASVDFDIAAFTNITHDHLDYHKTFKAYIDVKKALFDNLKKEAFALTNIDDKNGKVILQNTKATKYSYALKTPSDYKGKIIENELSGLVLQINNTEVYTRLIGKFNAYNLLTVYAIAELLGEDKMEILTAISQLKSVEGRFEFFKSQKDITCIVDYAHTPDALKNVLSTIQSFQKDKNIITVVGCGGDRDKTKRPIMAQIASEMSQKVILTSDNPRTESPQTILEEMEAGVLESHSSDTLSILNRKDAIKTAIMLSQPGDIVLIAGKGHEKYQDIKGIKHPFDDLAIAHELFTKMKK
ncbi:MAG: UDP-N-acetylmuramoyl-L-alanyl-D-glutamate--2,6-diaminopimelate ligase [Lentimonas sp.]|jgi:UDP-N-acetylmuramoyl-L-alanyl-D-glutamate--2,6-diaminopimelate ligase